MSRALTRGLFAVIAAMISTACSSTSDRSNSRLDDQRRAGNTEASVAVPVEAKKRVYTANDLDFSFAENAIPVRKEVANTINYILASNLRCADIDPDTLISASEAKSRDPALQIVCKTPEGQTFAVKFHAKDAALHKDANATRAIAQNVAISLCQIMGRVKAHSAMKAELFAPEYKSFPNGNSIVTGSLIGQNGTYHVSCHYRGMHMTDSSADLAQS